MMTILLLPIALRGPAQNADDRRPTMTNDGSSVSRILNNYRNLINRFVIGEISADEFEADYLAKFKADPNQVISDEFEILDELFADVDCYVSDPTLRKRTGGISGAELRARARDVCTRLYEGRP